jgi:hypothetical protein
MTDIEISKIIALAMHEYFVDDPWYIDYLLDILPKVK